MDIPDWLDSQNISRAPPAAQYTPIKDLAGDDYVYNSIAEAALACRQSFQKCLTVASLPPEWAENRLADFKLWEAGIGAYSTRGLSLDERLESKPQIREVVLNLLCALKSTIDQCRDMGRPYLHKMRD